MNRASTQKAILTRLKRRLRHQATWALGLLLLGLFVVLAGSYFHLRRSLPQLNGQIAALGLERPLEIVRDRHAIPHIFAKSEADAAYGLGFVHAQDRLWQLELSRRMGSGTLAEIFGPEALEQDRFFRTIGLHRAAREALQGLDSATRSALTAYAAGVNAYLAQQNTLPPEFELLRHTPRRFRAEDSLTILKLFAWTLSTNWSRELRRLRLSRKLSPRKLAQFFGDDPTRPLDLRTLYARLDPSAHSLIALTSRPPGAPLGSNNWAVAGFRSQTGKPLLANDPHLDLTAPSVWYLAHLSTPGMDVIGATIAGLPGVVLGRNAHVAWAFTNTDSDTQDLFAERLVPGDPTRYLTPEGPASFTRVRERIRVKGGSETVVNVRSTRHGPVVSDVHERAAEHAPPDHVLALSAVALRSDDTTIEFLFRAARSRNADELLAAARDFHAPQQNIVYADDAGQIGFVAAGRVPVRSEGNEIKGLAPAPGWLSKYDWTGLLPFEQLPQERKPASGRLVTANQDVTPPGYPHWITSEWSPPYRAERIAKLLDASTLHSLESFAAIQADVKSGTAPVLLPLLLRVQFSDPEHVAAVERLRTWDREMRGERPEPLLFSAWVRELSRSIYKDELGDQFVDFWQEAPRFLQRVLTHGEGYRSWCDDVTTDATESCDQRVRDALTNALSYLEAHYGSDPSAWSWDSAHPAHSAHAPFSGVPVLGWLFDVSVPSAGSNDTVNLNGFSVRDADAPFEGRYGAGYRALYDLAYPERSLFITTTGQSGHPLSPHYRDFSTRWAKGDYVPMQTDRETIERGALGTLHLVPTGSREDGRRHDR